MGEVEVGRDFVLEHFGVKGMKWGVRKSRTPKPALTGYVKKDITRKTKNGDKLVLSARPPTALNKALAKVSSNYRKSYAKSAYLTIHDGSGKRVGNASFWLKDKDDIYLNWIQIDKTQRGKGYATEILKAAAEHGKKTGRKRLVLEVPGNAPDARHIYEKMGFKETRQLTDPKTDHLWGGLTEMEYRFNRKGRR